MKLGTILISFVNDFKTFNGTAYNTSLAAPGGTCSPPAICNTALPATPDLLQNLKWPTRLTGSGKM